MIFSQSKVSTKHIELLPVLGLPSIALLALNSSEKSREYSADVSFTNSSARDEEWAMFWNFFYNYVELFKLNE